MLVSGIGLWIVHTLAARALMEGMRHHLEDIAATTAGRLDVEMHQALAQMDSLEAGSPEYEQASQPLVKLRDEVPDIYYAYTLIMRDGQPAFILDSTYYFKNEGDDSEAALPGEVYEDAPREVFDAWKRGEVVVVREPYTDKWGTFISAFAPLKGGDGEIAGIFGVDISMGQLAERRRPVNVAVMLAAGGCLIGSFIIGVFRVRADSKLIKHEEEILSAREKALKGERSARAGEKAKSDFLATMSHEIRTPLNGVLGMADVLSHSQLDEAQREQVEAIRHSGELLLVMLNDILDFSKIDAGAMAVHCEPIDLKALIREASNLYRGSAEKKGLAFEIEFEEDAPLQVQADPVRAAQVIGNLLSNAIKFTREGSVRIVVGRGDSETASISVKDSGIGIAENRLQDLFVPFTQLDASLKRPAGGTGLGLVISRRLAELMGGSVTAASELGVGSNFRFGLPIAQSGQKSDDAPAEESPSLEIPKELKVLVAEDVKVNQRVIGLMLERFEIIPDYADDGEAAVQAWREQRPDVILMDVQMPKMDGLEATRRIRQESGDDQKPWIIAITGGVMENDQVGAAIAGMNDFLAKPVSLAALKVSLAKVPDPAR